jgi:hypothetical protein
MQLASLRDSRGKKSVEEIAADSGSDESGNKTKKKKESKDFKEKALIANLKND